MDKLVKTQRAIERQMLNIKVKDMIRNEYIREKTKLKCRWVGHTMRQTDNLWNKTKQDWRPWLHKRSRDRPQTRWKGDLKIKYGP